MRAVDRNLSTEKHEGNALVQDFDAVLGVDVLGVIHSTNAFLPPSAPPPPWPPPPRARRVCGAGSALRGKLAVNIVVDKYAARFAGHPLVLLALSLRLVNTATQPPTPE
ncbi:hypothetical protein PsYK624_130460 [Phanerochaete sordida]|uniref:Uncharacterized protein n=1 Tax=Phanerochaete sordida TaxID=48140 RepID=A0A9P3GM97_9APHY|nr:hypothetical protein PsYK624_130460 [Phanerochaete sordida]